MKPSTIWEGIFFGSLFLKLKSHHTATLPPWGDGGSAGREDGNVSHLGTFPQGLTDPLVGSARRKTGGEEA